MKKYDAFDVYNFLNTQRLLENSPKWWWPNAGTFEVIIGAVLTQNTTWKNVQKSLINLKGSLELDAFVLLEEDLLKEKIKPSGFYNQKAPRLLQLSKNIQNEFQTFEMFQKNVTRGWLLAQKGIGQESADAILCYGCKHAEMVVDTYTKRVLERFGVVFKKYEAYKNFLETGMKEKFPQEELPLIFARFHGMFVEYNKKSRYRN